MKIAVGVGLRSELKIRGFCFQNDFNAWDGMMLGIVNNAANRAENGSKRRGREAEKNGKEQETFLHENSCSSREWGARHACRDWVDQQR